MRNSLRPVIFLAIFASIVGIFAACGTRLTGSADSESADDVANVDGPVGASAHALRDAARFKTITLEVQAMKDFAPTPAAVEHVRAFLSKELGNRDVRVALDEPIPATGRGPYDFKTVRMIESADRRHFESGDEAVIYALFVDGPSSENSAHFIALGHSYRNTSVVIYEDTLRRYATEHDRPDAIWVLEATILQHEIGHILGLGHCSNPECVMNVDVGSAALFNIANPRVPELDEACRAKLR